MFEIVKYDNYEGMYKIKWPDGVLSEEFYNLPRATEFCRRLNENPEALPVIGHTPVFEKYEPMPQKTKDMLKTYRKSRGASRH